MTTLYNCHNHIKFSHDSECDPDELCREAIKRGLSGIAITDHSSAPKTDRIPDLRASAECAEQLRKKYAGQLDVLVGIESGEVLLAPQNEAAMLGTGKHDIVLGSVHRIIPFTPDGFGCVDFSIMSDDEARHVFEVYLENVIRAIKLANFDVLSHLTYPLRYIVGRDKRNVDPLMCADYIDEIFSSLIKKDRALEVNTSELYSTGVGFMPNEVLLARYFEIGGRLVTVGSDAHEAKDVALGIREAHEMLASLGFEYAYYYRSRSPVGYRLK